MDKQEVQFLIEKSKHIRRLTIKCIGKLGVGHIGGALSVTEALVVLYYKQMNVNPSKPQMERRDRFVLSKGHAGPALYSVLADKGYFPMSELDTLNMPETKLPSHCDMLRTPGVDMTAGSLGQGISCAVGMAKGSKIKKDGARIYFIVGDGESQEGEVWEAAMLAAHLKLDNLIGFTDYNKCQIDGTVDQVNSLISIEDKWRAFGWNTINVNDGHDVEEISAAVDLGRRVIGKPTMIILNTIKGKGVSFIEAAGVKNHNMTLSSDQQVIALEELA